MRNEWIEKIMSACVKANPNADVDKNGHIRPITLSTVLCALREVQTHAGIAVDQDGLFIKPGTQGWDTWAKDKNDTPPCWDIYNDSLAAQKDNVLEFLAELV